MKVMIVAHAHPEFSVGGAEIAAYNLFRALKARKGYGEAIFLARGDLPSLAHGSIMMRRAGEYLWRQDISDWFRLRAHNQTSVTGVFREFLRAERPDAVFLHHYAHLGVDVLREIKLTLPESLLIVTLHEYLAICNRNGQMVKNKTKKLCYRESPEDCSNCFPERTPQDFWLRKHYIQQNFEFADAFVAPSEFLRQRYVEWGIPAEHIVVIENGQPSIPAPKAGPEGVRLKIRFGFFGQITEYKGVEILLQAIHLISAEARARMMFEIHGANLDWQAQWFQDLIDTLRKPLIADGSLRWVGPYEQSELAQRMSKVDWVVVPSIWWENSPLVIQEAFVNGKPVICAGIGGMREKVRDGVDGLHFEVRNPLDLAETMIKAATEPGLWKKLKANVREPPSFDQCADAYLALVA
ncbi:MAG: glycosyltransferase family 4 protein [Hyphomicrobiales bacterium]|nr:glycosyltransferase family 4 protein [Hyphomicrobiales bacterium]